MLGHGALIGRGTYRAWHIQGVAHTGRGTYRAGRCLSRMSLVFCDLGYFLVVELIDKIEESIKSLLYGAGVLRSRDIKNFVQRICHPPLHKMSPQEKPCSISGR